MARPAARSRDKALWQGPCATSLRRGPYDDVFVARSLLRGPRDKAPRDESTRQKPVTGSRDDNPVTRTP